MELARLSHNSIAKFPERYWLKADSSWGSTRFAYANYSCEITLNRESLLFIV